MPLALSGAFTMLLAQAAALCGSVTAPPASPRFEAAVVQRDDAFVIISETEAKPAVAPLPAPIRPANLKLGRAIRIDPALLAPIALRTAGAAR